MRIRKLLLSTIVASLSVSAASTVLSCTRFLHVDPNQGVFVARNMDWYERMQSRLIVYPRGIERQGSAEVNPLKWTSKYGSIVTTAYDTGATDGMNEKGLAIHGLWLAVSDYGTRDESIPGLSILMSMQFYLDNFKTVAEAARYTEANNFQMLAFFHKSIGRWVKIHLALEDATGDSIIIEYIDGKPKIYHSKDYSVMTNDPVYSWQLENLKQYSGFGGDKPLPGTTAAPDRFVRASYHGMNLPNAASQQEAVAEMFSVIANAAAPYEPIPTMPGKIDHTLWGSVADLTHHIYYFHSNNNFTTVYANLDKFQLQAGASVMRLDLVKHPELSGDVTDKFEPVG